MNSNMPLKQGRKYSYAAHIEGGGNNVFTKFIFCKLLCEFECLFL